MAPSYDNLPDEELFDEDEIDFSDLREQYEVRLEEGLDTFVVVDGLPKVPEDSRQKLTKFLLRKLNTVGTATEDGVYMPVDESGTTQGYVSNGDLPVFRVLTSAKDLPSSSSHLRKKPSRRSSRSTERRWTRSIPSR